jgi:hypothetical protein
MRLIANDGALQQGKTTAALFKVLDHWLCPLRRASDRIRRRSARGRRRLANRKPRGDTMTGYGKVAASSGCKSCQTRAWCENSGELKERPRIHTTLQRP